MDPQKSEKSEEKKRWGEELRGIAYLAISLLLFASLITYSPDDTSLNSVSTSPAVKNLTGLLGAYTSDILFSLFGGAAYLFPLSLSIMGWKRLKGEQKGSFAGRSIGFIVLLLSLPAFLHLHLERISVSIKGGIPAGGLLGNIITSALTNCCAFFGAHVITLTLVIISVLLTTGITPSKLIFSAGGKMNGPFLWVRNTLFKRKGKKREKKVTADTAIEEDLFMVPPVIGEPKIIEQRPVEKLPPQQEHFEFMDTTPDGAYRLPPLALLSDPPPMVSKVDKEYLLMNSNVLEKKLLDFGIEGQIVQVHPGPVITMYELEPAPGVKISRIVNLSDDLALAMKSGSVRIVAPIPGKSTVGIEIPNHEREDVYLKEIIASEPFRAAKSRLTLALGRDISGNPVVTDLARMPHLLVAGTTGSGKSVALNSMISSLLFNATPSDVKIVMIDPKILELSAYEGIPHLLTPVITQPKEASWVLQKLVEEMQKRYTILAEKGVRNIDSYNKI
ncbi:MAG TPA: DNA translocase FtsK 4TM domain-containing protein, partial [Nitrospirota bacterium]|nr:DNA translocase FtsK 4TM domain-containing protein [Nitrospirota bacterium]